MSARENLVRDLIQAVGRGEAQPGDVAVELRKLGVSSLEDLLSQIRDAQNARKGEDLQVPIKLLQRQSAKGRKSDSIVQRVPRVPVLVAGVLYDPADIRRFDGVELHFVQPAGSHLLAFSDHALMLNWWRLSYVTALQAALEPYGDLPSVPAPHQPGQVQPQWGPLPVPMPPIPGPPFNPGPGSGGPSYDTNQVQLFDEQWYRGDPLQINRNRGFADLTRVSRGFLGLGDWNDVISSVHVPWGRICVAHDHINWEGQSITLRWDVIHTNLEQYGWNDRISSIEHW